MPKEGLTPVITKNTSRILCGVMVHPNFQEDALLRIRQLAKKVSSYQLNIAGILAEIRKTVRQKGSREGHHPKTGKVNRNDT